MRTTTWQGKTALVTGAAGGIGRATSRALAAKGARVIIVDRKAAALQALAVELGDRCPLASATDVSDRGAMIALAAEVHGVVAAVDILINNAGVGFFGGLEGTSLDEWAWVLGSNLWGVIHGCHLFAPAMVRRGQGHIVNVASALGYFAVPGALAYVTAKFAVMGLSESLRAELLPQGVQVSAVCPGLVATGILQDAPIHLPGVSLSPDARRERLRDLYERWGDTPEDVADAILGTLRRPHRAVVPVSRSAQGLYYAQRFFPRMGGALGRSLGRWM